MPYYVCTLFDIPTPISFSILRWRGMGGEPQKIRKGKWARSAAREARRPSRPRKFQFAESAGFEHYMFSIRSGYFSQSQNISEQLQIPTQCPALCALLNSLRSLRRVRDLNITCSVSVQDIFRNLKISLNSFKSPHSAPHCVLSLTHFVRCGECGI